MFRERSVAVLRALTALIALSALAASAAGILRPEIYGAVVEDSALPFMVAQDAVTLAATIFLLAAALIGRRGGAKLDIVRIGIVGYMLYAYGPMIMGLAYTAFYFAYLAVFGLSIFFLIFAFSGIEYESLTISLPRALRLSIAVYCGLMPLIWAPQWIIGLMSCIQAHSRPSDFGMYWVYILDLCFVLPVCALTSILLFRNKAPGLLLGGILTIKGFTLMASVGLGNFLQPLFHQEMIVGGPGGAVMFTSVAFVFLILGIFYLARVEARRGAATADR
jgi:hypothetical protein